MNNQEKARARAELIAAIEREVEERRIADISDWGFWGLNEEREPNTAGRMEMLIMALLSGDACAIDIPEPKTFHGELKAMVDRRGWELIHDPVSYRWQVYRGEMKVACAACDGRGREPASLVDWRPQVSPETICVRSCAVCHGSGEVSR